MTTSSSSPHLSRPRIVPTNVRSILKSQMRSVTGSAVDGLSNFSFGDLDGRFVNNFPAKVSQMADPFGREYHRVGLHSAGDLSVAAP